MVHRSVKRPRLHIGYTDPSDSNMPRATRLSMRKSQVPSNLSAFPSSRPARRSNQKSIKPIGATTGAQDGTCLLERLPKEIRQRIYAYSLSVHEPVCVKQCCGPNSTRRERASCKKHGDHCSKIGKGNGLTLYDEDLNGLHKAHGRFVVLLLSRTIYLEASWVLHAQGSVLIQSTEALQPYLGKSQRTFHRLPNHATQHAKSMWFSVARFRNVRLELLWHEFCLDHPVDSVYRLYEATAFLLKAWSLQPPISKTPSPAVTVDLASLYTSILPFNSTTSTALAHEWTDYWQPDMEPGYISDFVEIGRRAGEIVERLVDLTGRHGGESQWKIVAEAPKVHENSEEDASIAATNDSTGIVEIHSLEEYCVLNGVEFETRA